MVEEEEEEEDEDEDEDDSDSDSDEPQQDPSDPISALDGIVLPVRLLPALRQLVHAAEEGLDQQQQQAVAAAPTAFALRSSSVPVRSLKGVFEDDGERLRLAFSLWCAGLVSTVVEVEKKDKRHGIGANLQNKKKNKRVRR